MKVLIKIGGTLLDDAAKRGGLARQLAQAASQVQLVVVHGGGKQVTRYLEERGVKSRFVNGLRVSDEMVIEAVTQVIAGGINKQLVSALCAAGKAAVGLSGVDGLLTLAEALNADLQFVGTPTRSDGKLFQLLLGGGYLPVVACLAADAQGHIYNVNADQMAVSCARGWNADKLFFLTDVAGVKNSDGAVIGEMTPEEAVGLIQAGVAHGGMQAKLEAAIGALRGGLAEVVIAPGQEADICGRLLAGEFVGTRLKPGASQGKST